MRHKSEKHHIDGLIALVLFGVFATCILSVLLTGSNAYQSITERDRETFGSRTGLQYISTKVRQAESAAQVSVRDFDGTKALCIEEDIEGRTYLTRIYCCDGWLYELFTPSSTESSAEDGEKVLEAQALDLSIDSDGLLSIGLTDIGGEQVNLMLSLRGEGAGI